MANTKQQKIGLALSSGGAKGLAHIGVIKVLEKNNIPIDFIAGSSIGALIGGLYAAFGDIGKVEKIALSTNWRQVFSLLDPAMRAGLLGGEKIKYFFEAQIDKMLFQDLKIPFTAIATDIKTSETVYLNKGEVAQAIRASISFPLVFKPVIYRNRLLADGGLSLPVPVKTVQDMGAGFVIAVNAEAHYFRNGQNSRNSRIGFFKVANNSLNILRCRLADYSCRNADAIIVPELQGNIYWDKFLDGKNIILAGEKAMEDQLNRLQKLI
ncbi:MAG: patatin-like phospholipase family protein [Patescibacteria group bacterium]|nr:patatin-like phospholipase family protein [Patescibacteria group bacterium]